MSVIKIQGGPSNSKALSGMNFIVALLNGVRTGREAAMRLKLMMEQFGLQKETAINAIRHSKWAEEFQQKSFDAQQEQVAWTKKTQLYTMAQNNLNAALAGLKEGLGTDTVAKLVNQALDFVGGPEAEAMKLKPEDLFEAHTAIKKILDINMKLNENKVATTTPEFQKEIAGINASGGNPMGKVVDDDNFSTKAKDLFNAPMDDQNRVVALRDLINTGIQTGVSPNALSVAKGYYSAAIEMRKQGGGRKTTEAPPPPVQTPQYTAPPAPSPATPKPVDNYLDGPKRVRQGSTYIPGRG